LLPKGYVVAFIVSTGTRDKVHIVNDTKRDTMSSESRRILKSVDLNKRLYRFVCYIFMGNGVTEHSNVQLRANGTGVAALSI